jgi:predicted flap endonuclease-1-like 5' DNA nuclease
MKLAEDLWLRGQAAQSSMMHLMAYNTAFAGTATIQAWKLGLSAPVGFWSAMGRAGGVANDDADIKPLEAPAPELVAAPPTEEAETAEAPVDTGPSLHLLDAPRGGVADDLTELSGIGSKLATTLNEFGIYHFDQIAGLDEAGIAWLNEQQPGFRMICARHNLVEQAKARLPV